MTTRSKEACKEITQEWTDQGLLIEAGFAKFRLAMNANASALQVKEMRFAFFAGAQHLWKSLLFVMEAESEPTDNDLRRMALINHELQHFYAELRQQSDNGTKQ